MTQPDVDVETIALRPRDSARERALVRFLRTVADPQRYSLVDTLIQRDLVVGLEVARSALTNRAHVEQLLERGILSADPSTTKIWLSSLLPKIGVGGVLRMLRRRLATDPKAVDNALYWMPRFVSAGNARHREQLRELRREAEERGVIRRARTVAATGQRTR